jgi:hypothetical protein
MLTVPDTIDPDKRLSDIVCGWIKACDESHELCMVRHGTSLPTRLVSINDKTIRLEVTETWQSTPRYATLSYCWGTLDFIRTVKSNLDEFLCGIPHARLPKTFRDAIQITQALAVDYIWIDSLCIVQDSDTDWRKESSRMSEVYGNSYINIAASSATDPGQGCFLRSKYMRDALEAEVRISGQRFVCTFHNTEISYMLAVDFSHLMTRAWAIQEKLLPTRTIHLGDRGALWDCRSSIGLQDLQKLETANIDESRHITTLTSNLLKATKFGLSKKWEQVVYHYSSANLTVSRDKLPGLAGIAKLFSKYKRCQYLAGIWKDDTFDVHLCWCVFGPRPRPTWRAPTWSWASVDGLASFHAYELPGLRSPRLVCAHTLEADVTRVSESEFGEVSDGWIRITCSYVVSGKIRGSHRQHKLEFCLDGSPCCPLLFGPDCTDDIDVRTDEMVFVLPFAATNLDTVQLASAAEGQDIRGLVLQQTGRALGEFRRIGFFRCGTSTYGDEVVHGPVDGTADWDPLNWNQFMCLIQEQGAVTAKEVCAEAIDDTEHGTGGFVISIV